MICMAAAGDGSGAGAPPSSAFASSASIPSSWARAGGASSSESRRRAGRRRLTVGASVPDRVVEPELAAEVRRQRLGDALLRGQREALDPQADAEVVEALEIELGRRLAVVLEALQIVGLEVELAADALADAALEAVPAHG